MASHAQRIGVVFEQRGREQRRRRVDADALLESSNCVAHGQVAAAEEQAQCEQLFSVSLDETDHARHGDDILYNSYI